MARYSSLLEVAKGAPSLVRRSCEGEGASTGPIECIWIEGPERDAREKNHVNRYSKPMRHVTIFNQPEIVNLVQSRVFFFKKKKQQQKVRLHST